MSVPGYCAIHPSGSCVAALLEFVHKSLNHLRGFICTGLVYLWRLTVASKLFMVVMKIKIMK